MKVYCSIPAFERHVVNEGDEALPVQSNDVLVVGGICCDNEIPGMVLSDLGYPLVSKHDEIPTHVLTRWWGGTRWEYSEKQPSQLIISIPIFGLMNENLGPQVPVGLVSNFGNPSPLGEILSYPRVEDILRTWEYTGFVSATMCGDRIQKIEVGVPYGGIFNIMEYVKGKLSEWWKEPKELRKLWAVSSLVSRVPYPIEGRTTEAEIEGLTKNVEKHFWLLDHRVIRGSVYSTSSRVGYATAWGGTLEEAAHRVLVTCRNLWVSGKQYRTDLAWEGERVWRKLEGSGVLG